MVLVSGCLSSPLPNGRALCASGKTACPSDYYCAGDNTCWRVGSGPDMSFARGNDLAAGMSGDMTPSGCAGLFCDSFESDVATSTSISSAAGTTLWSLDGAILQYAGVDIDGTTGALGTSHALRFHMAAMQSGGMIVPSYQRDTMQAFLAASAPNYVRILDGPTYTRFFVKLSAQMTAALGYINFGAGDPGDLEIDAQPDGVSFNTRFNFTAPLFTRNPGAVSWTGDWVCVEWENRLVPSDGGVRFRSAVSLNGVPAATFEGGGMAGGPVEQLFGADQEFRSDRPTILSFTQWIDEVVFSDQPVGCK
jgi:hypothetical protein